MTAAGRRSAIRRCTMPQCSWLIPFEATVGCNLHQYGAQWMRMYALLTTFPEPKSFLYA